MTQTIHHPRAGWQQEEIDLLFSAVSEAGETGKPLRDVFAQVGEQLSRKPNSIRNFYYARVRESPELAARQTPFRAFTSDELHELLRNVLIGRGQGESVRACVTRLAGGDRSGMLRYQNKYRSVLKNRPELLEEIAQELRLEGLPCPENASACRQYQRGGSDAAPLDKLRPHMQDASVRAMVDALSELLNRAQAAPQDAVPYRKWAEARREADRLRVEVDLLKMAMEEREDSADGGWEG